MCGNGFFMRKPSQSGFHWVMELRMQTSKNNSAFLKVTPFGKNHRITKRAHCSLLAGNSIARNSTEFHFQGTRTSKSSAAKLPEMCPTPPSTALDETMKIRMYVINAFTAPKRSNLRTGNPAAVALLDETQDKQLSDEARQELAAEMNLSETAFIIRASGGDKTRNRFKIRWFTPGTEVDLCGHATLAAAKAVLEEGWAGDGDISFETLRKGTLTVRANEEELEMDFPALEERHEISESEKRVLQEALGVDVTENFRSDYDIVAVVKDGSTLSKLVVKLDKLKELETRGVIVTASGENDVRFVSRFFAPRVGIGEDPVTGSAHCVLARLFIDIGEENVEARQVSERGGWLRIGRPRDGIVRIAGRTRVVWNGTVFV